MRKALTIIAVLFCAIAVMAGPHGPGFHGGHGPGPRPGWGPGPGPYYYGNRGLGIAYGVTGIVANSLAIVNNLVSGVVGGPVYTTPVYAPTPVVTTPVYTPPVYRQPVYTAPAVEYIPAPATVPYVVPTNSVRVEYNNYYPRTAPAYRYYPSYRVIY